MAKIYKEESSKDATYISQAENCYKELIDIDPTNERAQIGLFELYKTSNPKLAKKLLLSALKIIPESIEIKTHLAQHAMDFPNHFLEFPDYAYHLAQAVIHKDSSNRACLLILAEIYKNGKGSITKNIESALDIYRVLHKINPLDEDSIDGLSDILLNSSSIDHQKEGLMVLEQTVSLSPQDNDYITCLAEILAYKVVPSLRNPKRAYELFEKALDNDKNDICTISSFADFLSYLPTDAERNLEKAEVLLRQLFERAPNLSHLQKILICLERQRKIKEAIELLSANKSLFLEIKNYEELEQRLNFLL